MRDNEFTRILDWPGYRVFRHEINETAKTLRLWVRRKGGNRKLICSGCGKRFTEAHDSYPQCGVRIEKVGQLPSKAPFSKDFEDAVGLACESASVRQVARQFGLAASTVRAIDLRYLQRWNATRRKDRLRQIGVDEIYFGKQTKFITVVSNLETGEPLWFGRDRKQETLDEFFRRQLKESQRKRIEAACVDMWRPFTNSIEQWAPNCRIVYDKFHVLQHANRAIDEVRRAEFFRKGGHMRGVVKGKRGCC
jgi:transposase